MYNIEQEQRKLAEENQARLCYFITHHVSQINQLLKCSICFEVYQKPTTVFRCFHVFCEDCIKTYLEFSTSKEPPCPICQKLIPRNELRPNNVLSKVADFVNFARGRIDKTLECNISKPPSFEKILGKIKEEINEISLQKSPDKSTNKAPPDYNLIQNARKILICSNTEVTSSSVEEIPQELPFVSFRDGSLKTPTLNKRNSAITRLPVNKNREIKKDLFDIIKESPVTNPFFKKNIVSKTYAAAPQKENKNNTFADKIIEFEDNTNKIKIIEWLNNSHNNFDSKPLPLEENIQESHPSFNMPSVSQLHKHKVLNPVNASQINKQKLEQNKIRRKSDLIIHLSRNNNNNQYEGDNRRTRSLETLRKSTNQKLKRHSISATENLTIEQFNSEEEVFAKENPHNTAAIVNLIEEECLENMDADLLCNKPKVKSTKQPIRQVSSPKRSRRLSKSQQKTNKKNNNISGWTRMKEIKKTIRKVEIKPNKLVVSGVSRCSSTVTSNSSKEAKALSTTMGKTKNKVAEPVVVLERMNIDNAETNYYCDLDVLESYFSKQFANTKMLQQEDTSSVSGSSLNKTASPEKLVVTAMIHNTINDENKIQKEKLKNIQQKRDIKINEKPSFSIPEVEEEQLLLKSSLDEIIVVNEEGKKVKEKKSKSKKNESKFSLDQISKPVTRNSSKQFFNNSKTEEKLRKKDTNKLSSSSSEIEQKSDDKITKEIKEVTKISPTQTNHNLKNNQIVQDDEDDIFTKEIEEATKISSTQTDHNLKNNKIVENDDDEDIFMLPTQIIYGKEEEENPTNDDNENEIFTVPTQVINIKDMEPTKIIETESFEDILKYKINQSLQNILGTSNFISKLKILLKDIEQTISQNEPPSTNNNDVKEIAFLSTSTQTIFQEPNHKHAGIQTDSFDSPKGFRISSTDQFHTQQLTNTEMQTDTLVCPSCSFVLDKNPKTDLIINNPTAISSHSLLRDSNIIKSLSSEKYVLSESFDHIDFETQDVVKGKNIKGSSTSLYSQQNKENQNNESTKMPLTTTKLTPTFILPSQPCHVETLNKKSYKRIRKPTSDSDSDDGLPKNVKKKNKFVQDDLSLHFASELPAKEQQDELVLSGDSEGVDYGQYLQKVLKKCDEELMLKKSTPQQKIIKKKPPSKTQDMIEECKLILQEACSGVISIENTENINTERQNIPKPSILTLNALENEFQHDFNDNDKENLMKIDEECNFKNEDLRKKTEVQNKLSESLFSTADYFSKSIIPVKSHNSSKIGNKLSMSKEKLKNDANNQQLLTQSSLDEFIDVLDEFESSFEDNTEMKKESTAIEVDNKIISVEPNKKPNQIKILQNIVVVKNNEQQANGNESDDMFLSDSDVVETTPQKNKPVSLEEISLLSQAYYNPIEKIILPPLVDESPDIISSIDPPIFTALGEVFIPPPEFQDTPNEEETLMEKINTENTEKEEIIDLVHTHPLPSSSLTPDLYLPETHELINIVKPKEPFITSTQYENSQILPVKSLNLSPISRRGTNNKTIINPILAAQNSKFSPLNVVPSPQKRLSLITSTPKQQKSILNYVRGNENPNISLSNNSQSQKSVTMITNNKKPCVACTRMDRQQLFAITSLSNRKLISYSNTFTSAVTHMIVNTNQHNQVTDHTMKFVSAIAAGIWVLNFNWVEECLTENQLLPEEPFEALDMSGKPGPKRSRLMRTKNPLLKGFKIYPAPNFRSTTQKEVENVIKLLGGEVVSRLVDLIDKSEDKIRLIITEAKESEDFDMYEVWLDKYKVATVDLEWLSRSVGVYERLSLKPFTLCSEESICDLGYPAELLTDMPISFSHTM